MGISDRSGTYPKSAEENAFKLNKAIRHFLSIQSYALLSACYTLKNHQILYQTFWQKMKKSLFNLHIAHYFTNASKTQLGPSFWIPDLSLVNQSYIFKACVSYLIRSKCSVTFLIISHATNWTLSMLERRSLSLLKASQKSPMIISWTFFKEFLSSLIKGSNQDIMYSSIEKKQNI